MNKKSQSKKNDIYRIGIDARFFGLENKGLGRYTKEVIEWLDDLSQKSEVRSQKSIKYYILLREDNFDDYQPKSKNIYKVKADYNWYSWKEQLLFPFLLNRYKLDLVHFTHFNVPILYKLLGGLSRKNKFVVTIHDLILFHYPTIKNTTLNKFIYFFKLLAYHFTIRIVTRQADIIITISEFTKKDIVESLKISSDKIKVVYEGAEFNNFYYKNHRKVNIKSNYKRKKLDEEIFKKYGIIKKYLLYVGNAYPHKNLERLVLAFDKLKNKKKKNLQLVLVGKKDYFYKRLEEFINKNKIKNVIITDYVDDNDLETLYNKAELFVFPSLYEGFGLPPLEALVKGLPVLSSGRSSLKEILGDKVKYFDVENVNLMAKEIDSTLDNECSQLTDLEIEEIKNKYNWKKMSESVINIYLSIKKDDSK